MRQTLNVTGTNRRRHKHGAHYEGEKDANVANENEDADENRSGATFQTPEKKRQKTHHIVPAQNLSKDISDILPA
jgi:hypothetical protein